MSPVATTTVNVPSGLPLSESSLLFSSLGSNVSDGSEVNFDQWLHESVYASQDYREEQGPTLKFVLEVPVIANVKGLFGYLFPDSGVGFNPTQLLEQLSLKANGGWRDLPDLRHWNKGPVMAAKYLDLLTNFANKILSSVTQNGIDDEYISASPLNGTPRRWASTGEKGIRPIAKGELQSEPTLVLLDGSSTSEGVQLDWAQVLATMIYKPSDVFKEDAERECAEFAEYIFLAQPFRRFVVTVCLIDTTMVVMYFDRSGGLVSQEFDVHKQPENFLRIVLGMLFVDRGGMGIDVTASTEGGSPFVEVEDSKFELVRRIYSCKGLEGKGTSCFSGKDKDGNVVVIKDSWVDVEVSGNEVEILKVLNTPQADATPDDLRRHEESLCTPDGIRVIPKLIAGQNMQFEASVVEEGNPKIVKLPSNTAIIREALGLLRIVSEEPRKYSWVDDAFGGIVIRCQWRIVTSPKGARFDTSTAPTIGDLMLITHDIIYAIKALRDRNIVHRDICDMNIVIQRHKGMARGLLIDFDSASNVNRVMNEAVSERRGTLEFMALDRLVPTISAPHTYFHDLQSLFFVLCWFCSPLENRRNNTFSSRVESVRTRWSGFDYSPSTLESVLKAKTKDLFSSEDFENNVLKTFRPRYEMMKEPLRYFRRLLWGPWDLSAIARTLLMPIIVRQPQADIGEVLRYANLLRPSERSPTLVFLSMAEYLNPRELPGVAYIEGNYNALLAMAIQEQYFHLFAVPNPSVMARFVEAKRNERLMAMRLGNGHTKVSGMNDEGSDGSDGENLAEDLGRALEEIEDNYKKNFMASVNARVNEAFSTLVEEHPEIFVESAAPGDVFDRMHRIIKEYEESLRATQ